MSATDDVRLRGKTRWSLAARCSRMSSYALLGEEPEEPSEETRLRWARGKLDELWFVEQVLYPKYGRDNVVREKPVPWPSEGLPAGELHVDAFIVSEGRPFEIKSHFDGQPMDSDYLQVCGQAYWDPDCEDNVGVLVTIDRDLHWEAIPVVCTDERIERLEEIAHDVVQAGRTGTLPHRPCARPADGRARMCPFINTCFADWQPPDPVDLTDEQAELARAAYQAKLRAKAFQDNADEYDGLYRAAVKQLAELEPGRQYTGPGVIVKRTHVDNSERFSLGKARKAGVWTAAHDEQLGPFVSLSGAHDRYAITLVGGAPMDEPDSDADDDYGSVPF